MKIFLGYYSHWPTFAWYRNGFKRVILHFDWPSFVKLCYFQFWKPGISRNTPNKIFHMPMKFSTERLWKFFWGVTHIDQLLPGIEMPPNELFCTLVDPLLSNHFILSFEKPGIPCNIPNKFFHMSNFERENSNNFC